MYEFFRARKDIFIDFAYVKYATLVTIPMILRKIIIENYKKGI